MPENYNFNIKTEQIMEVKEDITHSISVVRGTPTNMNLLPLMKM